MGKKKGWWALPSGVILAAVIYSYKRDRQEYGWYAYAPLPSVVYKPLPDWVEKPQGPVECLRADFYLVRQKIRRTFTRLNFSFLAPVRLSNGYDMDFPISHYPEEKLSPELVADLRAWAQHYQAHGTELWDSDSTLIWDSPEALDHHLSCEEKLYRRLRSELPRWRRLHRSSHNHRVAG